MAHSSPGAPAPRYVQTLAVRDFLDQLDTCIRTLEGVVELIAPFTTAEAERATLLRKSVADALTAPTQALRAALDAGWTMLTEQGGQA